MNEMNYVSYDKRKEIARQVGLESYDIKDAYKVSTHDNPDDAGKLKSFLEEMIQNHNTNRILLPDTTFVWIRTKPGRHYVNNYTQTAIIKMHDEGGIVIGDSEEKWYTGFYPVKSRRKRELVEVVKNAFFKQICGNWNHDITLTINVNDRTRAYLLSQPGIAYLLTCEDNKAAVTKKTKVSA